MTEVEGKVVDYADHFWGDKHHGFHVLYENIKRGEETVNEVAQFVKERLTMEEEYSKLLSKTVNKVSSFVNNGSAMEGPWSMTRNTFDILVDVQTMMVKNLQDLSREVGKYKDDIVKSRKEAKQQDVIDAVNLMQTTTTCLQKAKETYNSRLADLERIRKESNPNAKELSKVESKLVKAKDEYSSYVEKYDVVRQDFQEKMVKACKYFQNHDRSLFAALQQFLLVYTSHHKELASSSQQLFGQLRESLQEYNIDEILLKFVKEKGTGREPPGAISMDLDENVSITPPPPGNPVSISPAITATPTLLQTSYSHPPTATGEDLLSIGDLNAWTTPEKQPVEHSPTSSQESDATLAGSSSLFSASVGTSLGQKKLSMFIPKRKKTISQGSLGEEEKEQPTGGLFKFRQNRRSKKSTTDLSTTGDKQDNLEMEDTHSTASSSRSDEKQLTNGSISLLDTPVASQTRVDEEGYTIPQQAEKEDTNWSSCSSDEEDEISLQQSKIRNLTIKPADSVRSMNASVDELRDAVGHISIGRSNTFDRDPWSSIESKPPLFSQSLTGGSLKPLKPAHTADGRFRTNFSESEFSRSNVPLNFSASCGPVAGMARARPRSNTPTHNSSFALAGQSSLSNIKESQDWGSVFGINHSSSQQSLGESTFNLSQSTTNLMQATINEQRVSVAMAINEYSHVWFKGANTSERTLRTFGTVMISFAAVSIPLLTDVHSDIESLQFSLKNAKKIKAVLPNKQLILPPSSVPVPGSDVYTYTFDKLGLANWLLLQQKEKPQSAFYNTEVIRYELADDICNGEPPLLLTSYWKTEQDHTDIRIDYRLNSEGPVSKALLNLTFSTVVEASVLNVTSEPQAKWDPEKKTLTWTVTELSKFGDCSGSFKARVNTEGEVPKPSNTNAQFQSSETISEITIDLDSIDTYHLSMVRRKLLSGKYFCDPELRK